MKHFEYYPKIEYAGHNAVNLLVRGKIRDAILSESALYYTYYVADGETAEILSDRYYGNSKYVWAIFYANNIFNPTLEWPMSDSVFNKHLEKKYGSIENSHKIILHHEYVDPETKIKYIIDENTYTKLSQVAQSETSESQVKEISAYTYEFELNNKKRSIVILDKKNIISITNELKNLFK